VIQLTEERLQKYMAHAGIASRRKSEEIIKQGKVKVNGHVITQMGFKVSESDKVEVDGELIESKENRVYYAINKPTNFITTTDDQFDRDTVLDLIDVKQRVYPVGRLDFDSSGLLLITNDGELTNILIHPSYEVWKKYLVEINSFVSDNHIEKLSNGVVLEDGLTAPAELKVLKRSKRYSKIEVNIREGKNRQIRRMFKHFGYEVTSLHRTEFGPISLNNLESGQYRKLTKNEIRLLKIIKDENR